jgi:glyoxylase I family protein
MPDLLGVSHVDLTVRHVPTSAAWYQEVFGLEPLMRTDEGDRSAVVMWHQGAKLAICVGSHVGNDGLPFDEARTGLDHLSLRVRDRDELEAWAARLDELGVKHSPVADESYGSVLVFRDPDNIQLELFCGPPR